MVVLKWQGFFEYKYNSSKNIKVTIERQHMAIQVLIKRFLFFTFLHPGHNICKEIFTEILICFKCRQLEDQPTSSCPMSKYYKICSLCAFLEHTHHECTYSIQKCINCEEYNDHSTLAMSGPFWKRVPKKKCQEIIQSTITITIAAATRSAILIHIQLIHIPKCLHITIVLATLRQ